MPDPPLASGPVLCVRRGGLGDTLLTIPLLGALRRRARGRQLHFAGFLEWARLLQRHRVVDRAFSSEDLELWALAAGGERAARVRERLGGYSWIVGDGFEAHWLAGLPARVDRLETRPRSGGGPAAAQLVRRLAGADDEEARAPATLRERRPAPAREPVVTLHPGAGGRIKRWPLERWLELACILRAEGILVRTILGEAEADLEEPLRAAMGPDELLVRPPLEELEGALGEALAHAGNDSGVTHLAAALRVPTVAVFGPTDPDVWAPAAPWVRVVGRHVPGWPPSAPVREVALAILDAARRPMMPE